MRYPIVHFADFNSARPLDLHVGQAPTLINNQMDLTFQFDEFAHYAIHPVRPQPRLVK